MVQSWPMGFSGKSNFHLSDALKTKLSDLVGAEQLEKIEVICIGYLAERDYYSGFTVAEKRKELGEIEKHTSKLIEMLSDPSTLAFIQNQMLDLFKSKELSAKLAQNPYSTFASAAILNDLRLIHTVCDLYCKRNNTRGRIPGDKQHAEWNLVERLYFKCYEITGENPKNNPKGMLQRLLKILSNPLGLGNNGLNGTTRSYIDEKNNVTN